MEEPDLNHESDQPEENVSVTRSGRISRPPTKLSLQQAVVENQVTEEYTTENAKVIIKVISLMCSKLMDDESTTNKSIYSDLWPGQRIKTFGESGKAAAYNEMRQRMVFEPINVNELSSIEKHRAMKSLIFQSEKCDGSTKGSTCANGSTQRHYMERDETASPTVITESIILTSIIDAKERRDVITVEIPITFVQTEIENSKKGERIIIALCSCRA
jgi:hypothetical protein